MDPILHHDREFEMCLLIFERTKVEKQRLEMAKRTRRNAKKKKGNGSDDQIRRKRDRGARSLYQRGKRFRGVNVLPGVG